jgi:ferredoxin-NADP reductase
VRATHSELNLVLEVQGRRNASDGVCVLTLCDPQGAQLPQWTPGAHIDLELGSGLVRQYSLCGDPTDRDSWQVAVLLEQHSRGGSSYVHATLTPGTTVEVRGPRNHFPLVPAGDYLFIAGGIGITPLVAMIADVAARGLPWQLVYGGRSRSTMAFTDELIDEYGERVRVHPEDEYGPLPLDQVLNAAGPNTAVYCCGPESLISALEELQSQAGAWALHVERFTPRDPGQPAVQYAFEVEAARSGRVVTVQPDESILDALMTAGVRVLSSCAEGICGTCEVSVLDGKPDHRDSILTVEEREASQTMFVCVSRSLSTRLVLDI